MTESEWLICSDPDRMFDFLLGPSSPLKPTAYDKLSFWKRPSSDRKWRLFGCACCRSYWAYFQKDRLRKAIEASELFADGLIGRREVSRARREAARAAMDDASFWQVFRAYLLMESSIEDAAGWDATEATAYYVALNRVATTIRDHVAEPLRSPLRSTFGKGRPRPVETDERCHQRRLHHEGGAHQCALLRDVFGNPFREATVDPSWLTPEVMSCAQAIYANREFDRINELAAMLERAGCTNDIILEHCRDPGPHVLGCWALELFRQV
jgi:hypothetical protein